MCSAKEKLDEFLNKFSNPLKVFREVCNKEKDKVRKEAENYEYESEKMKEHLLEEAKQMLEQNNTNFKKSKDFSKFKYKVELLQNDDSDHKTLRDALGLGSKTVSSAGLQDVVDFKLYRVKASGDEVSESKTSDDQNILLLHGTEVSNVEGILKEGLKPSLKGKHGSGVYSTNSIETASEFGECLLDDSGVFKSMIYLFIIKLNISNSPSTKDFKYEQEKDRKERKVSFSKRNPTYQNGKKILYSKDILERFVSVRANIEKYEKEPPMFEVLLYYKPDLFSLTNAEFDSKNNKIFKGTFTQEEEEILVLSHHDLVKPAYLVEIEVKYDLCEIIKDVLYRKFNISKFYKTENSLFQPQSSFKNSISQIGSIEEPNYSVEMFVDELKKEIEANQQPEIKLIESQFYHNIKLQIPQLTFELSDLLNSLNERSIINKTVLLESSDKNYEFIMRSLNNKGCEKIPKVLHMFRIIPADQTHVKYLYNNYLFLQGVTADKIMNILKHGYPINYPSLFEQHIKHCFKKNVFSSNCSCCSSAWLNLELKKGTSYCRVGDEVKELSFVFVTSDVYLKDRVVPSEVALEDLDSRRCRFDPDFSSPSLVYSMVPAYLIVFSL